MLAIISIGLAFESALDDTTLFRWHGICYIGKNGLPLS